METRKDKIERIKDLLQGKSEKKVYFASYATDGKLYREKDLTTIYYKMTFDNKVDFESWKVANDIDYIAYSPDVLKGKVYITLDVEHEPLPNAKPCSGNVITFCDEEIQPAKEFIEREAKLKRLCSQYSMNPPIGFEIERQTGLPKLF